MKVSDKACLAGTGISALDDLSPAGSPREHWLFAKLRKAVLVTVSSVFITGGCIRTAAAETSDWSSSDMTVQSELIDLFDYEVQNRTMAYTVYQWLTERKNMTPDVLTWYQACFALELLTRERYAAYVEKYGLNIEARFPTRLTIWAAKTAYYVIPELTTLKQALKQTIPYVDNLKRLREIAPEDHEFFDFVVAQEELQVEMLTLRVGGQVTESTRVLNEFIEGHGGNTFDNATIANGSVLQGE